MKTKAPISADWIDVNASSAQRDRFRHRAVYRFEFSRSWIVRQFRIGRSLTPATRGWLIIGIFLWNTIRQVNSLPALLLNSALIDNMKTIIQKAICILAIVLPAQAEASIMNAVTGVQSSDGARECSDGKCSGDFNNTDVTRSSNSSSAVSNSSTKGSLVLTTSPSAKTYSESNVPGGSTSAKTFSTQAGTGYTVDYYVQFNGPKSSVRVPVLIDAHGKVGVTGGTYVGYSSATADTSFYMGSTDAPTDKGLPNESIINRDVQVTYQDGDTAGIKEASFDYHSYYDLYTNTPYEIIFKVSASTLIYANSTSFNSGGLTASAELDPTFTLDPSLKGYSISYSAGLSSVSAVPLPASAPMFGAALATFAFLRFGQTRKRAAA